MSRVDLCLFSVLSLCHEIRIPSRTAHINQWFIYLHLLLNCPRVGYVWTMHWVDGCGMYMTIGWIHPKIMMIKCMWRITSSAKFDASKRQFLPGRTTRRGMEHTAAVVIPTVGPQFFWGVCVYRGLGPVPLCQGDVKGIAPPPPTEKNTFSPEI